MHIRRLFAALLAAGTILTTPILSMAGSEAPKLSRVTAAASVVCTSRADTSSTAVERIVARTNAIRRTNGACTLTENPDLDAAAQIRLREMIRSGVFSHTRPDGSHYDTVCRGPLIGENLTRFSGYPGPPAETAVMLWKQSESHFHNMIDPHYRQIGAAVMQFEGTWYACQILGGPGRVTSVDGVRA